MPRVLDGSHTERHRAVTARKDEFARRKAIVQWMAEKTVRSLSDVGRSVATDYKNPEQVLQMVTDDTVPRDAEAARQLVISQGPKMLAVAPEDPGSEEEQNGAQ